jgi:hypothetical protein
MGPRRVLNEGRRRDAWAQGLQGRTWPTIYLLVVAAFAWARGLIEKLVSCYYVYRW